MKYLKLFNESFELDKSLRDYLSDMLLEIEDLGLIVKIDDHKTDSIFSVKISSDRNYYKSDDVYYQLLSLQSYMKSFGWSLYYLSCIYFSNRLGKDNRIYLTDRETDEYSKIEELRDILINDSDKISRLDLSFMKL